MFILYTVIAWIGIAAFAKVLYIIIQPDQIFDKLFHWQAKLQKWGVSTGFWNEYKYRSWGGCALCFSRFVAFWGFWVYLFMCLFLGKCWLPLAPLWVSIIANIIWWTAFCSISTIINIFAVTKL